MRLNADTGNPNLVSASYSPTATVTDNIQTVYCEESFPPQLGFNYLQGMEKVITASVTATFYPASLYTLILDGEY